VTPDGEVQTIVARFEAELGEKLNVVVGKTSTELDSRRTTVRGRESTMGNLITDAMRAAVGTEIAITNGGGIRGNRIYDAGASITRKDLLGELPFGNVTVTMSLSGADLWAALENAVSRIEDTAGRFAQVSGLRYVYDPAGPKGSRVVSVTVGGKPLDKGRNYTVATNDYMARGGDGYAVMKRGKVMIDTAGATLMASQVMDYLTKQGTVAPKVEGRITAK
ncbi:MAG: bifunctional metallophosphatase/5'-nucleotidase, partial [Rhodospirillaceae bacterium]|nr:bifunctional metallophosphatase/5'-nucleotidase [Rhodospirillaceae bacterium]